jgi:hypothetical protein
MALATAGLLLAILGPGPRPASRPPPGIVPKSAKEP